MRAIWKYPLALISLNDTTEVKMPQGAQVLAVQAQSDYLSIWALVDTDETEHVVRRFHVVGTGHDAERIDPETISDTYLGTAQFLNGALVLHVFDAGEA